MQAKAGVVETTKAKIPPQLLKASVAYLDADKSGFLSFEEFILFKDTVQDYDPGRVFDPANPERNAARKKRIDRLRYVLL